MSSIFEQLKSRIVADKYRLDEVIGRGGFSAVYRGEHLAMSRVVAIKILTPQKVMGVEDKTSTQRFSREAKVISQLRSPHTITVFDYGTEDGLFYLVMEYIDGRSLKDVIKNRGEIFAPERAAKLAIQMLSSLEEAHHYGVLHRDLKPANIMLARDFRGEEVVKVVDFGIAKVLQDAQQSESSEPGLTQDNSFVGTPRYAAPEQLFAQRLSAATDVYGIGLILWEMLTGKPAVVMSSWYDCSTFHMENRKVPMCMPASANIPRGLVAVVERAVMRHVPQRYQSAAEMREALEAWLANPTSLAETQHTQELKAGIPRANISDSDFRLPQAAAPSVMTQLGRAPELTDGHPSLEEDSLVLVRDKQIFDPNLSSAEFYFGADEDDSRAFSQDPAPSSQVRARRLPGRETQVSNMPESYAGVELELEADIASSSPSMRSSPPPQTPSYGPPGGGPGASDDSIRTQPLHPEKSGAPDLFKPLGALVLTSAIVLGGVLLAKRYLGEEDADRRAFAAVDEIAAERNEEPAKEEVAPRPAAKYSTGGIILAIKSAGWKKGSESEVTDLSSFTQQTINFHQGDRLKCEVTLIEARSGQIIKELASVVKPPHRFIIFDTKAVKISPMNDDSRQATRALENTLERYRDIVDEQETEGER